MALAALAGVFLGVSNLLPSPSPQFSRVVSESQKHRPPISRYRTVTSIRTKHSPTQMVSLHYGAFRHRLKKVAHTLKITILTPKEGYFGTVLDEAYTDGQMLNLVFNNMIVMESPHPIIPTYQPTRSTPISLSNGVGADWEFIPGDGGPMHRLMFRESGTYIRLQLYHPQVQNSLASAERIAETFSPLGG